MTSAVMFFCGMDTVQLRCEPPPSSQLHTEACQRSKAKCRQSAYDAIYDACLQVARIPNEEQTLHQHFGRQWEEHCKRTWRLLPPIF